MPSDYLVLGRVVRPHGVRGELLLEALTDFPEHLLEVETVYVGREGAEPEPHRLDGARLHRGRLLIRLAGCADRDAAEAFRGLLVQIPQEAAAPLPPGTYYYNQILGLPVYTDAGEHLGAVADIIETGANDVYVVQGAQGEVLVPALRSVILEVDLEQPRMTVRLPEGLR